MRATVQRNWGRPSQATEFLELEFTPSEDKVRVVGKVKVKRRND